MLGATRRTIIVSENLRKYLYLDVDEDIAKKILGDKAEHLYDAMEKFMETVDFQRTRGSLSIYHSIRPMSVDEVSAAIDRLLDAYPFLKKCIRDAETGDIFNEMHIRPNHDDD